MRAAEFLIVERPQKRERTAFKKKQHKTLVAFMVDMGAQYSVLNQKMDLCLKKSSWGAGSNRD